MTIRRSLRTTLSRAARRLFGAPTLPVIDQLAKADGRFPTFCAAFEYLDYEAVPGDVLEFGVFTGKSLALFAHAHGFDPKGMTRRIVGFDSFRGLPPSAESHERWQAGDCAVNHSWHPLLPIGAPVTPAVTFELFAACHLPRPEIEAGDFAETLPATIPGKYSQVALAHLDCDLYESTRDVLAALGPVLADGAMLLFDDWFHYKGHPGKGEARAFHEFLADHPEWGAQPYRSYGSFCQAFILYRR